MMEDWQENSEWALGDFENPARQKSVHLTIMIYARPSQSETPEDFCDSF